MPPFLSFVLNVAAALAMGVALGLERQFRGHPAGLRTNALVCVGAALFVSLSDLLNHGATRTSTRRGSPPTSSAASASSAAA